MKNDILGPVNFIFCNLAKKLGKAKKNSKYIDTVQVYSTTFKEVKKALNSTKGVYQYQNEIGDDGLPIENNWFNFDFIQEDSNESEFSILVLETIKGSFDIQVQYCY